jgi:hypothetical protein
MEWDTPVISSESSPASAAALVDLDTLLAEVGATFPLLAYAAEADEEDESGVIDAMILAGLVSP